MLRERKYSFELRFSEHSTQKQTDPWTKYQLGKLSFDLLVYIERLAVDRTTIASSSVDELMFVLL
jgi:hypothetical protein